MIEIDVDSANPTLRFRFEDRWLAVLWDGAPEEQARRKPGRKCVDLVAAHAVGLLIEVKDDRIKAPAHRLDRRKTESDESFFDDIAKKADDSARDVLDVASQLPCAEVYRRFGACWTAERRRFVLWWELP